MINARESMMLHDMEPNKNSRYYHYRRPEGSMDLIDKRDKRTILDLYAKGLVIVINSERCLTIFGYSKLARTIKKDNGYFT